MNNRLGCLSTSAFISAIITALIVVSVAFTSGSSMFSPGKLNAVPGDSLGGVISHAQIGKQCAQCHTAIWNNDFMSDRCVICHMDTTQQFADPAALHGFLSEANPSMDCLGCHTEHHGAIASLTTFITNFPHERLGYSLAAHPGTTCADCHNGNYTTFDPIACTTCHRELDSVFTMTHVLAYGTDCLGCHDGIESIGTHFDHVITKFPLTGLHQDLICTKCHLDARTKVDMQNAPTECINCHADDETHEGRFGTDCETCHSTSSWKTTKFDHDLANFNLTGKHINVTCEACHTDGIYKGTLSDCASCHQKDDTHEGKLGTDCGSCHTTNAWNPATYNHNLSAFKLTGAHIIVECEQCHQNGTFKGTPVTCVSCHTNDDDHNGQFGTNCGSCHNSTAWKPATFDHNLSSFKLTGSHQKAECSQCHKNGVFKGTPSNCFACHAGNDKHNGSFGTNCGSCHNTSAWKPANFDHNLSAFKLSGAHINVNCSQCHQNGVFKGTPSNCFACHANNDNHNGGFGTNCGSCHSTTSWKSATFDHNLSAFKLTGAHLNVNCSQCHKNGVFKGTPSNCFACHANNDNHNGGFGTNCGSCHSTTSWKSATFNHNLSAFKLTGAHLNVSCGSCHKNGVFKGTASNCSACHADPAFHSGMFGTNCAQCHSTSNWKASYTGPHPTFKDKGGINHEGASCRDCHTQNLSSATCLKCHENNNPGGDPSRTPQPTRTPTSTAQSSTATSQPPTSTQVPTSAPQPTATPQPSETPQPSPTPGG